MNFSPKVTGLLQALGVALYVVLFVLVLQAIIPDDGNLGPLTGPVFMLLAFSASALICGSIVFLRPATLFFSDRKKEAVQIIIWTAIWLAVIFALFAAWLLLN